MVAFSRDAVALNLILKDCAAAHKERVIICPGLMSSVDLFFRHGDLTGQPQRVVAIYNEFVLRFIAGLYPQLKLHIGSEIGPNVPIGSMISRRMSQRYGLARLLQFLRGISTENAIGMILYWEMRGRLVWRAMIAGMRRRAGAGTLQATEDEDHFE